jgi:hypothetical protein
MGGTAPRAHPQSGSAKVLAPKITTSARAVVSYLNPLADFYERLLPVEAVEAIYADWRPDGLEIWLVVYHATEADREQIYNHELALMQVFPGLGVDIYLLDRSEVDPVEVVDLTAVDAFLRFPRSAYA